MCKIQNLMDFSHWNFFSKKREIKRICTCELGQMWDFKWIFLFCLVSSLFIGVKIHWFITFAFVVDIVSIFFFFCFYASKLTQITILSDSIQKKKNQRDCLKKGNMSIHHAKTFDVTYVYTFWSNRLSLRQFKQCESVRIIFYSKKRNKRRWEWGK